MFKSKPFLEITQLYLTSKCKFKIILDEKIINVRFQGFEARNKILKFMLYILETYYHVILKL